MQHLRRKPRREHRLTDVAKPGAHALIAACESDMNAIQNSVFRPRPSKWRLVTRVLVLPQDVIGSRDKYDEIAVDIYCRWEDVF